MADGTLWQDRVEAVFDGQDCTVAPDGSLYTIHNRTSGTNIIKTVTINASSEVANGVWKLRANDSIGGDTGYIDSWSMQF